MSRPSALSSNHRETRSGRATPSIEWLTARARRSARTCDTARTSTSRSSWEPSPPGRSARRRPTARPRPRHGVLRAGRAALPAHDAPGLRLVAGRTETGAAYMAGAWGRLTGRPGMCLRPPAAQARPRPPRACTPPRRPRRRCSCWSAAGAARPPERGARPGGRPCRVLPPAGQWRPRCRTRRASPAHRPGLSCPHPGGRVPSSLAAGGRPVRRGGRRRRRPFHIVRPDPGPAALARLRTWSRRPNALAIVGGGGWSAHTAADVQALCERWQLPVAAAFGARTTWTTARPATAATSAGRRPAAGGARARRRRPARDRARLDGPRPRLPPRPGAATAPGARARARRSGRVRPGLPPALALNAAAPGRPGPRSR